MKSNKYMAIAEELKREIESGVWPVNGRISTEQVLAEQYSVSRQTVRQALDVLVEEGYVHRRQGSGTFVSERARVVTPSKPTRIVGMITPWSSYYVFTQYLTCIEDELRANGCMMLMRATHNDAASERDALLDMMGAGICGLIVECTGLPLPNPNLDLYRELRKRGIPIVFMNGYYSELEDNVFVNTDDRDGGYWLTSGLIDEGFRHVGGFMRSDQHGMNRYYGCIRALMDRGVPYSAEDFAWFYRMDGEEYIRFLACEKRLALFTEMDALVCYNDVTAVTLYKTFAEEKFDHIPKIVCFDNSDLLKMANMPIQACTLPFEQISRTAVRKLMNMIDGKSEAPELIPWGEHVAGYRGPWLWPAATSRKRE